MSVAIEPGVRGMAHAEAGRVALAAGRLAEHLQAATNTLPERLEAVVCDRVGAVPAGLPPIEGAAYTGRKARRILTFAFRTAMTPLATEAFDAVAAEAERLHRFAATTDALVRFNTAGTIKTLGEQLSAMKASVSARGPSDQQVPPRVQLFSQLLAHDLGLPAMLARLRVDTGAGAAERIREAVAAFPDASTRRGRLDERAHRIFAPLVDLIDHHLDTAFSDEPPRVA